MYDPVVAVRNSGSGIIDNSFDGRESYIWRGIQLRTDAVYHGKVSVVKVITYVLKTFMIYSSVKLCSTQ